MEGLRDHCALSLTPLPQRAPSRPLVPNCAAAHCESRRTQLRVAICLLESFNVARRVRCTLVARDSNRTIETYGAVLPSKVGRGFVQGRLYIRSKERNEKSAEKSVQASHFAVLREGWGGRKRWGKKKR